MNNKFIIMNKIEIFQNPDFGQVRVTTDEDNNPLFSGIDVAKALGYKRPGEAVATHCKSSGTVMCYTNHENSPGGSYSQFINEANLYRLIMKSQLDSAEKFQDWVVEEVLPSIRKHGAYNLVPRTLPEALRAYAAEVEKNILLEEKVRQQTLLVEELQPKADYCDKILKTTNCLTVREIAKDYGMTAQEFNRKLNKIGIQYKQGNTWLPYAPYARSGYTKSETILSDDSSTIYVLNTKWAQKGRLFLYNKLKDNGILPLMEQENE